MSESDRPFKRLKFGQSDERPFIAGLIDVTDGPIGGSESQPGPLTDPLFDDHAWSLSGGLASPSQMLMGLSQDLDNSWTSAFLGEENSFLGFQP